MPMIEPRVCAAMAQLLVRPTASQLLSVVDVLRYFGVIAFDPRQDLAADVFDVILVHYGHIDLGSVLVVVIKFDAGEVRDLLQLGLVPLAHLLGRPQLRANPLVVP